MSNATWRVDGTGCRCWQNRRVGKDALRAVPTISVRIKMVGSLRLAHPTENYAVTASAKSSSSSSSIGEKVESGLVESVIGLRLP